MPTSSSCATKATLSGRTAARRRVIQGRAAVAATILAVVAPDLARAQTDFYNTDRGRPVQIEDAYVTERYAFELKLAPVRAERTSGGTYNFGLEPELALGDLPRTQIEVGLPLAFIEQGSQRRSGIAGLDLSAMHNVNVETEGLPAFALRGDVLAPVGNLAPDRVYSSLTGMATRTYRWARFHVNGQYTFGASPNTRTGSSAVRVSRWAWRHRGLAVAGWSSHRQGVPATIDAHHRGAVRPEAASRRPGASNTPWEPVRAFRSVQRWHSTEASDVD